MGVFNVDEEDKIEQKNEETLVDNKVPAPTDPPLVESPQLKVKQAKPRGIKVTFSVPDELRVIQYLPQVLQGPYSAGHIILDVRRGLRVEDWDNVEESIRYAREQQQNGITLQNESMRELKRCEHELRIPSALIP